MFHVILSNPTLPSFYVSDNVRNRRVEYQYPRVMDQHLQCWLGYKSFVT